MSMDRRSGTLGRGWGPAASPSRADITLRALRSNSSSRFDSGFRSGCGDDLGYSTRTCPDQLHLLPRADRAEQSGLPTSSTPGASGMWTCLQVLGVLGILAGAVWVARRRPLSSSLWFTWTIAPRAPSCTHTLLSTGTRGSFTWNPPRQGAEPLAGASAAHVVHTHMSAHARLTRPSLTMC